MKHTLLLLALLVIATTPTQAQDDNPYARFGHKGKIFKYLKSGINLCS